ncbi:DUF4031 domain-containing protein [Leucobacter ruminantium]|uniref:DUF4031 domain-containing protein n=1 Tax=Leucobacter ruminantium TaxID=1289170 RepID=A0A939LSY8_9MICO|nr:DUF4031 domain-containing protein [Leucobacter ruminantium]MBO1804280.1 DUF4031 domain-containing protein [Leucobacter ruminantium]
MAILIDPPAWPAHGTLWSHLVSDTATDELHAFAKRLRIPRRSFDLDHYDVPASLHDQAVAIGARPVTAKDVVHALRDSGLRVRQAERPIVTPLRRRQYLTTEWQSLGELLGATSVTRTTSATASDAWLSLGENTLARWSEPHRSYHDERHLEDVLLALDHLATRGERVSPESLLAAWFHDAVYLGRSTDETASAQLAVASLEVFPLDPSLVSRVGEFIVATAPDKEARDPSPALAHLLDADLSIFAAPRHRYEEYAGAVRAEYAHVADPEFAEGRSLILSRYLERPAIYRTATARQLWEERARRNVADEIARLRANDHRPARRRGGA